MRHSFLPAEEQKVLKRGYHIHVVIVGLFLLSVAGLIGIGSLFPAFTHVHTEEQTQLKIAASIRKNKDERGIVVIEDALRSDAALLVALSDQGSATAQPSSIIGDVITARGSIKITSIALNEITATSTTITVQGNAPTRESLVSFKTRMENTAAGAHADLPLSALATSKNIPFSMNIFLPLP